MPFTKSRMVLNVFTKSRILFDVFTHHACMSFHAFTQEKMYFHEFTQVKKALSRNQADLWGASLICNTVVCEMVEIYFMTI